MKKYFEILNNNPLFHNIKIENYEEMIEYLEGNIKNYLKNETVLFSGDKINFIGIILNGNVKILKDSADGEQSILNELGVGEIFGEVFNCVGILESPVTVIASEKSEILFINFSKIINENFSKYYFNLSLTKNMLKIMAQKTLHLNQKIDIVSKKKLRDKIICYLNYERKGKKKFSIPFNRQQLANYICADRSAVSNELSKMQIEGIIKFTKQKFEIFY